MRGRQSSLGIKPIDTPQVGNDPRRQSEGLTDKGEGREVWSNQWEFFFSCLGYAVGYGNIWRFPYLCYKNGGAAFLIPYFTMLFIAGIPLFFMELVLGQYISLGPHLLFANMAPILSGLGISMLMVSLLISIYFNLIFAWSLFYTFASFTSQLPWETCTNQFNTPTCYSQLDSLRCLQQNMTFYNLSCVDPAHFCKEFDRRPHNATHCKAQWTFEMEKIESITKRMSASEDYFLNRVLGVTGKSWEDMGSLRWDMVGCLALAWAIIGVCMIKGIKSSGKVVYFTATFPYLVLLTLLIRGITLEGSYDGISFYFLQPNITRLKEPEVWNDAATQIFYSLGSSAGVLITLASYNNFNNNCMRDAIAVSLCNCCTSVFAGFAIFSIIGFMAHKLGVKVNDVVQSGSGLAFVAYPEALAMMPVPAFWSVLFFLMLITVGVDSQFSYMETIATALLDYSNKLRDKRHWVMAGIALVFFLSGLTMCLDGGMFMFELFVFYSSGISLIVIGLLEVLVVVYVYGFNNIMSAITKEMKIKMPEFMYHYWYITWRFLTPVSLVVILMFSIYYYIPAYLADYVFPTNIQVLGWFICLASIILTPLGAILVVTTEPKNTRTLFKLLSPTEDFCPAHIRSIRQDTSDSSQRFRKIYEPPACIVTPAMEDNNPEEDLQVTISCKLP